MRSQGFVFNSSEVKNSSDCSQGFCFNSRSERSQRFYFSSSEVKQCIDLSQRFHFNNSEVKWSMRMNLNASDEVKQRSKGCQRYPFISIEVK